jgi:hypothetical protein
LTRQQFAVSKDTHHVLLPLERYDTKLAPLVIHDVGTNGLIEGATLNKPTLTTRQTDFAFTPDGNGVFFTETASTGAPNMAYFADLRMDPPLTTQLGGATNVAQSTGAISPASSHVAYTVAGANGALALQLVDIRTRPPGPPVRLNGTGKATHFSWQPIWQ